MALSKEDKQLAFNIAVDITKAYGPSPGGTNKFEPAYVLKQVYEQIKGIREDIDKIN